AGADVAQVADQCELGRVRLADEAHHGEAPVARLVNDRLYGALHDLFTLCPRLVAHGLTNVAVDGVQPPSGSSAKTSRAAPAGLAGRRALHWPGTSGAPKYAVERRRPRSSRRKSDPP